MLVLGIESTCDETGCAIVRDGREILANVVTSQIDLHNTYGGVVPELACRRHVDVIIPVIDEALRKSGVALSDLDLIAVAHGPGLVGALMIGVTAAKSLSIALNIPFVGVNHTEAHLYAALMSSDADAPFPALGAVLSGGHTALVEMQDIGSYSLIGQTCDDAVGEAFDKAAKIMGLPYPGGPVIEKLARDGDPTRFSFRAGRVKNNPLAFSFSGLKTAVLYAVDGRKLERQEQCDIAAAFQQAAFDDIVSKIAKVSNQYKSIVFGGGVTNNRRLREMCAEAFSDHQLIWPSFELTLDNAAMIAGLGYHVYGQKKGSDSLDLEALPNIPFVRENY